MKIPAMCLCVFAVIVPAASLSTPAQTKSAARASAAASASAHGQPIEISIAPGLDVKYPRPAAVLVCSSKAADGDPCKQIQYDFTSQQSYGQDVTSLAQGPAGTLT